LSFSHTISRGAASWTSPFIVMAIGVSPGSSTVWRGGLDLPSKARARQKEGAHWMRSDAYSQRSTLHLLVMAGLVPAIHIFLAARRGCPAQGRA
jgi:hypothetical protein